jgi:hypothetical protein
MQGFVLACDHGATLRLTSTADKRQHWACQQPLGLRTDLLSSVDASRS